jgi:hypothetical protein
MPVKRMTFEAVRELARELGDLSEEAQAIKAGGNLWAWIPPHKSIEPGTIAVRVDLEQRAELIEGAPEVYYVTDHYLNSSAVLVRLGRIDREALRGLLAMSREFVVGTALKKGSKLKRSKPKR